MWKREHDVVIITRKKNEGNFLKTFLSKSPNQPLLSGSHAEHGENAKHERNLNEVKVECLKTECS